MCFYEGINIKNVHDTTQLLETCPCDKSNQSVLTVTRRPSTNRLGIPHFPDEVICEHCAKRSLIVMPDCMVVTTTIRVSGGTEAPQDRKYMGIRMSSSWIANILRAALFGHILKAATPEMIQFTINKSRCIFCPVHSMWMNEIPVRPCFTSPTAVPAYGPDRSPLESSSVVLGGQYGGPPDPPDCGGCPGHGRCCCPPHQGPRPHMIRYPWWQWGLWAAEPFGSGTGTLPGGHLSGGLRGERTR